MNRGPSILVVDDQADTEQVLRAVLEPKGVTVSRTAPNNPVSATRPDVMIIQRKEAHPDASRDRSWNGVPRVVIGSLSARESTSADEHDDDVFLLDDPFHYGELIRAIETFLG